MQIKKTASYQTSDGKTFNTHKAAVDHEVTLTREKQLTGMELNSEGLAAESGEFNGGLLVIPVSNLAKLIAKNGDAILAALTVKQNRGPKAGTRKST